MKKLGLIKNMAACIGMLILIFDSKTALEGAQEGITLIMQTVVPSLFPFFFLSILLSGNTEGQSFSWLRPLGILTGVSKGKEMILIPAFFGGYPAGAQAAATGWRNGLFSKEEAERMLSFCSNAGPSFLFGILTSMFPHGWMVWALWGIHLTGALLTAKMNDFSSSYAPLLDQQNNMTMSDVLLSAVKVMVNVCGWLMLFRIVITFLDRWLLWLFPGFVKVLISGLLELTNGCCSLMEISDVRLRFILCSTMLSSGGICVLMQTQSVTKGLSIKWYLKGKLMQTFFCVVLSYVLMYRSYLFIPFLLSLFLLLRRKKQKNSSVLLPSGV